MYFRSICPDSSVGACERGELGRRAYQRKVQ